MRSHDRKSTCCWFRLLTPVQLQDIYATNGSCVKMAFVVKQLKYATTTKLNKKIQYRCARFRRLVIYQISEYNLPLL